MDDVARVVLALEEHDVAEEVMHFLDRSGRARVVATAADDRQLSDAVTQLEPDAVVAQPALIRAGSVNGSALIAIDTKESVEALRLAITGRVWNRDDGSVELIAEGSGGALASLQNWLNEGPPGADVREVERTELGGKPRYEGFNITWSAPRGD